MTDEKIHICTLNFFSMQIKKPIWVYKRMSKAFIIMKGYGYKIDVT